jgi:hypothetical protein
MRSNQFRKKHILIIIYKTMTTMTARVLYFRLKNDHSHCHHFSPWLMFISILTRQSFLYDFLSKVSACHASSYFYSRWCYPMLSFAVSRASQNFLDSFFCFLILIITACHDVWNTWKSFFFWQKNCHSRSTFSSRLESSKREWTFTVTLTL